MFYWELVEAAVLCGTMTEQTKLAIQATQYLLVFCTGSIPSSLCLYLPMFCTGKVFYWELVEAAVVKSFAAHSGAVCSIAMHPEGSILLTAGTDGSVRVWK